MTKYSFFNIMTLKSHQYHDVKKAYEFIQSLTTIFISKSYEYKIKSIIKNKLKALYEFELPLILKSGLFPEEAANLDIFKNYNGAISKTSSDYSNLSIKEDEGGLGRLWRQ